MAVSDTDLTTAEGVKKLMDELSARGETVIFAGYTTPTVTAAYPGTLSDFETIVVTVAYTGMTGTTIESCELAAESGATGKLINDTVIATVENATGGFCVTITGNSTARLSRIVGIRAGGV